MKGLFRRWKAGRLLNRWFADKLKKVDREMVVTITARDMQGAILFHGQIAYYKESTKVLNP